MLKRRPNLKNTYDGMTGLEVREAWSWGQPVTNVFKLDHPHLDKDKELVQCGQFAEFHYWPLEGRTSRQDKVVKIPEELAKTSHVGFDFEHPYHRLYLFIHPKLRKQFKKQYWDNSDAYIFNPADIAEAAGGKHATDDYPDIQVKPIGILKKIVYATEKGDDNFSLYIHTMGEETGIRPALCVDETGWLWIVGGDYTVPIPGITN